MATTPPVIQAKITSDPVKLPVMPLFIAVVLGVVIATSMIGGFVYYLLRTGKVPIRTAAVTPAPSIAAPPKTHSIALEPLLVNLADSSGSAFLRVGLTLEIADPTEGNQEKKDTESKSTAMSADAALRDTALTVLGRETSERLLAPQGKETVKKELKAALAERNSRIKVVDLFFTEFLVQR
ncbi:MAG TPA: flagellar basal body-associated FliL family protein [Edaphobacter sp.]|jgi:flagellar FliL protein